VRIFSSSSRLTSELPCIKRAAFVVHFPVRAPLFNVVWIGGWWSALSDVDEVFEWKGQLEYGDEKMGDGPYEVSGALRPGEALLAQLSHGMKLNVLVEQQYGHRDTKAPTNGTQWLCASCHVRW
jgi:hypothetical protein